MPSTFLRSLRIKLLIGVTGDTHNNLKNISKICNIFNERRPSFVIHTGDITLAKSLKAFSELKMSLIGVFGNNDELEKASLLNEAKSLNFSLNEEPHLIEIKNKKILILHHPELINNVETKNIDFIFHGHTHMYRLENINNTIIFNPGECAGMMEGKNNIGLVDIDAMTTKIVSF